jgi:ubiquitin-protein ligase
MIVIMLTTYHYYQSVTPAAMRRLMRELVELKNSPPEGVRVVTSEDNMLDVTGIIEGPGEYILCGVIVRRG